MKANGIINKEQIFDVNKKGDFNELSTAMLHATKDSKKGIAIFSVPKTEKSERKSKRKRLHMCNVTFKEGRWDIDEHKLFIKSCLIHGNNWKKVQEDVKTRSAAQIRSHAQKFLLRLKRKYNYKIKSHLNQLNYKPEMCDDEKNFLEKLKISNFDEFDIDQLDLVDPHNKFPCKNRNKLLIKRINSPKPIHDTIKSEKIFKIIKLPKLNMAKLKDFQKIVNEMIIYNDYVMEKLLKNNEIEEDYHNALSWINENSAVYNAKSEFDSFIISMNNILNGWKYIPLFENEILGNSLI